MTFQAYLDNIKEKTGKSPEDFRLLAGRKGLLQPNVKAGDIVAWLKEDFGLGRGHAMAIYMTIKPADGPASSVDQQVAKHFSGGKAGWQKTYSRLMTKVESFGPDVRVQPTSSYISVLRGKRKFAIVQTSADRLDVGIKLKGIAPTDRLIPAGTWNTMVTHRVRIEDPRQVDAELIRWLREAYDRA
jgi:hypothetical protein